VDQTPSIGNKNREKHHRVAKWEKMSEDGSRPPPIHCRAFQSIQLELKNSFKPVVIICRWYLFIAQTTYYEVSFKISSIFSSKIGVMEKSACKCCPESVFE